MNMPKNWRAGAMNEARFCIMQLSPEKQQRFSHHDLAVFAEQFGGSEAMKSKLNKMAYETDEIIFIERKRTQSFYRVNKITPKLRSGDKPKGSKYYEPKGEKSAARKHEPLPVSPWADIYPEYFVPPMLTGNRHVYNMMTGA